MSKRIFDTVRKLLGRGFTQAEVDALDAAIEASMQPDNPSEPEVDWTPAGVSEQGIALIHQFEGFAKDIGGKRVQAYPDPGTGAHPWTIGWGTTTDEQGKFIAPGAVWSHDRANQRFKQHLAQFERDVIRALGDALYATSQPQFDALVSFHYNTGAIDRATLTRKHVAGDHAGAAREFDRWNRAGGRVMKGLVRRRAAERALYETGS